MLTLKRTIRIATDPKSRVKIVELCGGQFPTDLELSYVPSVSYGCAAEIKAKNLRTGKSTILKPKQVECLNAIPYTVVD